MRVRVPTILQMEAVECGAAALAMVLGAFGRRVPLEELRSACGVSRDGSKASNMLKAARAYGLIAKGYKKEPAALRALPMPAILHWNFNHFVVLEGFRRRRVYLNDPGSGPMRVSEEELDTAFTGVVLTFEPGPAFRRGGHKRGLIATLAPRLVGSHLGLLYVLLAGFALILPGILGPSYFKIFVDDVVVRGLASWLRPLVIVVVATGVLQMAITWLQQRHLLRLETKLALSSSCRFFWHVLRLPVDFFNQRYAGEIGNRVALNDRVASLLSGELATALLSLVVVVFFAVVMFQYDVALTLASVFVVSVNLVALKLVARLRVDLNQRLVKDRGNLVGVATGGLQIIETLKASASESDYFSRWAGHQAKVINTQQRLGVVTHLLQEVPTLLLALNTAVLLGLGGLRVIEGQLSMGMLMAFQALMLAFIMPINRLVSVGGTVQEAHGYLNRLDDVLLAEVDAVHTTDEAEPDGTAGDQAPDLAGHGAKLAGYVELRNVAFGYSRLDPPLIKNFELRVAPGKRVALVGGSGSGKSTVAKLIAGLYQPWEGEILFDGVPRSDLPARILTNSVGMVDQEILLFEGTVRDNLTLWDATVSEPELVRAVQDAAIHEDLTARPGGFDGPVDEGGQNFSGGQRQRLEIARALATNPAVLILDEATSALDPATEKLIDDSLRRRGVTCILVAHRLSTIRDCDEILVLDNGSIVERGTHEELMVKAGAYQHLIAAE